MTSDAPTIATIIVPAWRLSRELGECLDALANLGDGPSFEVVVVINGGGDEIASVAEGHRIVDRVVRLEANVGFGAACNLAARDARGEYLVFLNDDTRVDPFWLRALVDAAEADPARAIVASLLLEFDGAVQEAGSRLTSHGGTVQLGRGLSLDDAKARGLLEARRIDYGSGAALLVGTEWFRRVGGFDPIFEPAYFEDVDLSLRIAELGGIAWFEPKAKALHHSGRSTSSDRWFRQFAANRSGSRFVQRWAELLASTVDEDAPPSAHHEVPRAERPAAVATAIDDAVLEQSSVRHALDTAQDYTTWLVSHLEREGDRHLEIEWWAHPESKAALIDRNRALHRRVLDLEARGPLGVAKARVGLWLNQRRSGR